MPVAQSGEGAGRNAALLAVAAFVSIIGVVILATQIGQSASSTDVGFDSGSVFRAGKATDLAPTIAEQGPLPLPDVAGGTRDIILQHVGDTPETGWRAFAARPAGVGRHCVATWNPDNNRFDLVSQDDNASEPCPEETYPPDGSGLDQLPVTVDGGIVTIDINAAERAASTTTP